MHIEETVCAKVQSEEMHAIDVTNKDWYMHMSVARKSYATKRWLSGDTGQSSNFILLIQTDTVHCKQRTF